MVQDHDGTHVTHTSEGIKVRSDRLAGSSTIPPDDAPETSEAAKMRSAGLSDGASASDIDDTDEATKMESDGLRDNHSARHSATTEAEKMESDRLH